MSGIGQGGQEGRDRQDGQEAQDFAGFALPPVQPLLPFPPLHRSPYGCPAVVCVRRSERAFITMSFTSRINVGT
jgi:hypothetical protein